MDRKYAMILGIGITLAVILGATGIGYAVYMGNTYSEHNTMDVVENSIDIYKDGDPIETPISMPEYRKGSTSYITGYRVATTGPGSFYLQCQMGDNAAWPLIESMSMTISDAGHPSAYPFGVIRDGMTVSTGVPTSSIAMSEESTFTSDGDTLLYYDFTIEIVFSNIDIQTDPNWERLSSFEGTQFVFVFVPS